MTRGPEPLRNVIARHGLSANKALGQNFILDRQLLARIAELPGPLDGARVYEVGPGPGGLTRALLEAGASVVAVERDRRCIPALAELREEFGPKLEVVEADALKLDEPTIVGSGAHVVANLPYNVGTALLLRWLEADPWPPWWRSLTLMFQREVADRIVARSGTGAYGRLSVAAQWRARPSIAMTINRSAFVPPPKVTSAVVHIEPAERSTRRKSQSPRKGHRSRFRPTPQNASVELEILSGRRRSPGNLGNRPAAKGGNAERRGIRALGPTALPNVIRNQSRFGVGTGLAAATVGPRVIADESCATCGHPLGAQICCSFCRFV